MTVMRDEIAEIPSVVRRLLADQEAARAEVATAIRRARPRWASIVARGTSDHAGVYAQYVWGSRNGLPVALAAPSLFTRYAASPDVAKALVVGISPSSAAFTTFSTLPSRPPPRAHRCGRPALQFLQKTIEALEVRVPDGPILLEPGVGFAKRLPVEPPGPPLGILSNGDEPRPLENFQVFGDRGLADREWFRELRDRCLAAREASQNGAPAISRVLRRTDRGT